jgi:predicted transcriptional regulator
MEASTAEANEERRGEDRESEGEEAKEKESGGDEDEKEQKRRQRQWEIATWADAILRLAPPNREAYFELGDYLMRGIALDSDFVSKLLGVSQSSAHRVMLSFRSVGLIGVAKIPNYAYGEGYQYVYYTQKKTIYGGGVAGYFRKRICEDLTGREVVASLSPKDVPSADMIVQNSWPLIIHAALGDSRRGLRLSALKERIRMVIEEFSRKRSFHNSNSTALNAGRVIVVTPWRKVAEELNKTRREGKVKGCLCAIPFAKKWVDLVADYALNYITLGTLLGGEQGIEDVREEASEEEKDIGVDRVQLAASTDGDKTLSRTKREAESNGKAKVKGKEKELEKKVLTLVRELGGVQPRVVAERLNVPLPYVSEAVSGLKREQLVKISRNLPYIDSLRKANAIYYLDASRPTALHDTLTNILWKRNIELGGRSKDYCFEYNGKTWYTDGLLENNGGKFMLEIVGSKIELDRVLGQVLAYMTQIGYNGIRGVVVVVLDRRDAEKLRRKITDIILGSNVMEGRETKDMPSTLVVDSTKRRNVVLVSTLRGREEKLQLESLLLRGDATAYHKNPR